MTGQQYSISVPKGFLTNIIQAGDDSLLSITTALAVPVNHQMP